jgi:hypothetical protein
MSSVKPKRRRRKIPYIGPRLGASDLKADYPLTPEDEAAVARALAEVYGPRDRSRKTKRTSNKTVRAK